MRKKRNTRITMMRASFAVTCMAELIFERGSMAADDLVTVRELSVNGVLLRALDAVGGSIDSQLFLYQTPAFQWVASSVYRYADFRESLGVTAAEGVAGKRFYVGEDGVEDGHVYGLVNVAAFLAQSMKETIQYDACDENSWDLVNGKYPLSNACGQLGQSYQDYHCSPEEAHMECPVDPNMSIEGVTHAKWYGAPGPLFCGPKSEYPHTGFWDHNYECNKLWANPPESCDAYENQKAGRSDSSVAYANMAGRTDVEGCCWWGRGVIQTTGICNFGKLNYFLGAGAANDGRPARYPEVDFCKDPEVICSSPKYKELKWIAGEFYWMESVQSYNEGGWNYTTELHKFVQGGMAGTAFIDAVSGIVNRGCHNPPCGTGAVDGRIERAENFKKVLDVLFGGSLPQVGSLFLGGGSSPSGLSVDPTGISLSVGSSAPGRWYPDYNPQYSLGKCANELPTPSGRPLYESADECCQAAYSGQASGVCLDSLSGDVSPTRDSPWGQTDSGSSPDTPQPTRQPVYPSSEAGTIISSSTFINVGSSLDTPRPTRQPLAPSSEAGMILGSSTFIEMEIVLESAKDAIDSELFLYETPALQWVASGVYRYADFVESLRVMVTEGVAGKKFYIGESGVENGHVYGLVNVAAFLAQSMKETIQYDACDEVSWDLVNGKYPFSNACGQFGQSYQDYHCSPEEAHMECPVDPNMSIKAATHAKWHGAPGPLFCGPKSKYPHTGFWDHNYECHKPQANPPETCDEYEDQKAGRYDVTIPYANTAGRTDVDGCCWWGRGVIQTSGVCNFGKLNYFLGAGAANDGRPSRYPKVDFCKDPEVICSSSEYKELKWIAGELHWMENVQSYNEGGWDYTTELYKFVQGGMTGTAFIDAVSGIVNRGCHNPPCGTGVVDGGVERAENFKKVLDVLFDGSPPQVGSLPQEGGPYPSGLFVTPTGTVPSSGSGASGRWYPDYEIQFSDGKCANELPTPSGRPLYNSGEECCQAAYPGQTSGVCLDSLPQDASPPSDSPGSQTDPASSPDKPQPTRQPVSQFSETGTILSSSTFIEIKNNLESVKDDIDSKLFLYQTPAFQWVASSVYRYANFVEGLQVMATEGIAGKKFYIGESGVENGYVYGLVNIAAFLAQSMKETIQYDACDENSWDLVNGKYPLSNACGQFGQSYQDYHCSPEEAHMECPVDPNMSIKAATHAKWYGAPGPLFCGPKSKYPHTGFWDHSYECNKSWANPPETCDAYEGHNAGRYDNSIAYANTDGRTDVEGCCWWGRGAIQTSGVCNLGKLNYFLGSGAANDGRPARYPKVDFCKDPEVICSSSEHKELKWIAGVFYWIENVQSYNVGGWDYTTELRKFVQGGITGTVFIDAVSGIVNRGCHNPPCGTGPVDGGWEREQNFKKVLNVLFSGSPPQVGSPSQVVPTATSTALSMGSGTSSRWYPDYNFQISLGKCMNKLPAPSSTPLYDSGEECCKKAYAKQASGVCLSSLPQLASTLDAAASGSIPESSMADAFVGSVTTHHRQGNNFITYVCGSNTDISIDSVIVDIMFDYEISVAHSTQARHLLPDLKKQILGDLAHTLGCQATSRKNLRRIDGEEVLLGYQSARGSDVIDGEKGSCSKSTEADEVKCVPVIGHLAAFFRRDVSVDVVFASKNVILHGIQDGMTRNSYSNITQNIVYVSEHTNEPQQLPNNLSSSDHSTKSSNTTSITIAIVLVAILFGIVFFVVKKRKRKTENDSAEVDDNDDELFAPTVGHTIRVSPADQELRSEVYPGIEGASSREDSINDIIDHNGSSAISAIRSTDAMDIHTGKEA